MTETLGEQKNDDGMIVKRAEMLYSKSYRERMMTFWSNGKVSISGMMYDDEDAAKKQIDFFCNIKVIDTRK